MPNETRFALTGLESCDDNVMAVAYAAPFIMHNIVITVSNGPNETFPRECLISNNVSDLPLLASFRKLPISVSTERKNCRW